MGAYAIACEKRKIARNERRSRLAELYRVRKAAKRARQKEYRNGVRAGERAIIGRASDADYNRAYKALCQADGEITAEDVRAIRAEFAGDCPYCLAPVKEGGLDHIVPVSKGGTNARDNLVWCCRSCNAKKKGRSVVRFLITLHNAGARLQWLAPASL